jgi:pyruvate/oxaloacetate carboxyltransferase
VGEPSAAGNLTYDGLFKYTFDAWNRLAKVEKAYRDANGDLKTSLTVGIISYNHDADTVVEAWEGIEYGVPGIMPELTDD